MAEAGISDRLADYLEDAHAMESSVLRMLDSMIATTKDPVLKAVLQHHHAETQTHADRLKARLDEVADGRSRSKDVMTQVGALMKGLGDLARSDKPIKNARDGYMVEHLEIATYELLISLAERAGDQKTVRACRENLEEERLMARVFEENWDRFVELTLDEEKVTS